MPGLDTKIPSSGYVSGMLPRHAGGPCSAQRLPTASFHTDKPQNPLETIQSSQQAYPNGYMYMFKERGSMSMQGLKVKMHVKIGFGKQIKVYIKVKLVHLSIHPSNKLVFNLNFCVINQYYCEMKML